MLVLLGSDRPPGTPASSAVQTLNQAQLTTPLGSRTVELPHKLEAAETQSNGAFVRYRLSLELNEKPQELQGVLVRKMSLAGTVRVNGESLGSCEHGELTHLRCLHQPWLFPAPAHLWRAGINTLDIELYANDQQINGLAPVMVGDAQTLNRDVYRWLKWWKFDLVAGLTWFAVLLGLCGLAITWALPQERVYLWFGLTCLVYALSNVNVLVTQPLMPLETFNMLVFASRLWCVPMMYMLVMSLFGKDRSWMGPSALGYCALAGLLIVLSDNPRRTALFFYLALIPLIPVLSVAMMRWTWVSRSRMQSAFTVIVLLLFGVGLLDFLRLGGSGPFEGVYLMTYGFGGVLLVMGALQLSLLAKALGEARSRGDALQVSVNAQKQELRSAQKTIEDMQRMALRVTENISAGTYVLETDEHQQPRFTFVSDRFLQMLDLRREEVMADPTVGFRCVHPEDFDAFMAENQRVFTTIEPFHWEGRIVVRGQERWLQVESVPRRLDTGGAVWEGLMLDITEQKMAELALQETNAKLLQMEVERSRHEERERLLQDMHDGFGSQLASARLLAEKGEMTQPDMAQILQDCMADLHLVMDTLGQNSSSLTDALADFRYRTQQRLGMTSLQLHWSLELDQAPSPPKHVVLHLLRILQEALNNAIRHSGAHHIWIHARHDPASQALHMSVTDDGCGMPSTLQHGRGLNNMRNRAHEIGGHLDIRPSASATGTTVELVWPQPHRQHE